MKFLRGMGLLFVIIGLLGGIAHAQEENPLGACRPEEISGQLDDILALLTAAKDLDAVGRLEAMVNARMAMSFQVSYCAGLDLAGERDRVFEPMYIPAGIYRVTATTEGSLHLTGARIGGDCLDAIGLFNIATGDAVDGEEQMFAAESACALVWAADNVSAPFTVTWEKLANALE